MLSLPARPLILGFGAAIALFDLVALLPGNPDFSSTPGLLILVAVQALIVWRLLHHSQAAWFLALLAASLYVLSSVLVGGPYDTTLTVSCFLALMQIGFLLTPPVLAYVLGKDSRSPAH